MVPDAGFADAVFGDAVIAPIPGMDLSLEMQHLYLEVEKRGAFNREVSIIRAKVQRWMSKGEISGVEERARVIYGAILDAAQVEGLTGEWVRFLGKYLAKQATASARSSGVEWHLDRHEDWKKALELFLGEKVDSADDGGGTDGGGSGNKNMIDWNKLDLVLGAPWSRPTAELPYEIFKQKVVDSIAIYHLKGEPELYYILRNFSGPLRDDINVMIREKLSEGISSSDIVMRVWEYLDDRFSGTFNKGEALLRWERLAQKEDERVEDYFVRIDKESSLLCSVFGKQHLELEKCVRARMGLLPKLSKAIESLGKAVDRMSYKELRGEAMHFESQLGSGKNRWEAKSSPDLAPKRAAAGAYSPDILGVIAGVKSREIWPRDVLAVDSGIDWQIVQFLLR
ncbi:hypothetical protein FOZ60_013465 [Perkinsus olseni]|uniref:Uncharacterized protein n=1 Tax=Perkinsus olseni TaxID=32597 RepID=A0A7J6NC18_PEROL|nr:hypothetical protein FOZ60_013465 [Perkinsus olseni]